MSAHKDPGTGAETVMAGEHFDDETAQEAPGLGAFFFGGDPEAEARLRERDHRAMCVATAANLVQYGLSVGQVVGLAADFWRFVQDGEEKKAA